MKQGDMELANHSAHHRGAKGDEDMDREIGTATEAIWKLTPGRSKLMALNLGGGTRWETTRTLRHYLDKYHQFDASSGSLGMYIFTTGRSDRKWRTRKAPARPCSSAGGEQILRTRCSLKRLVFKQIATPHLQLLPFACLSHGHAHTR